MPNVVSMETDAQGPGIVSTEECSMLRVHPGRSVITHQGVGSSMGRDPPQLAEDYP